MLENKKYTLLFILSSITLFACIIFSIFILFKNDDLSIPFYLLLSIPTFILGVFQIIEIKKKEFKNRNYYILLLSVYLMIIIIALRGVILFAPLYSYSSNFFKGIFQEPFFQNNLPYILIIIYSLLIYRLTFIKRNPASIARKAQKTDKTLK